MDRIKFRQHLDDSLKLLLEITRQHCYNSISENFEFIIEPSGTEIHNGMNDFEANNLSALNRQKGKSLTNDRIVDLLCHENKVPLWINTTFYESKPGLTVVHLLCSRRLRSDHELFYGAVTYPPFNVLVPLPPDPLRKDINGKFDINWKKELDDKLRPRNIFSKLKKFFIT